MHAASSWPSDLSWITLSSQHPLPALMSWVNSLYSVTWTLNKESQIFNFTDNSSLLLLKAYGETYYVEFIYYQLKVYTVQPSQLLSTWGLLPGTFMKECAPILRKMQNGTCGFLFVNFKKIEVHYINVADIRGRWLDGGRLLHLYSRMN